MVLLFWVNATFIHKIYMVHCELGDMVQDVELLPKLKILFVQRNLRALIKCQVSPPLVKYL